MRKNRLRTLHYLFSVCAGVLLGVGSVLSLQGVSLPAAVVDNTFETFRTSYRMFKADGLYRRRSLILDGKQVDAGTTSSSASTPVGTSSEASTAPADTGPIPADCATKVAITQEFQELILPLIPHRPVDLIVRTAIEEAFQEYLASCSAYIKQMQAPAEEPSEPAATHVDRKHCDQYTGKRRMNCLEALRDNIRYR